MEELGTLIKCCVGTSPNSPNLPKESDMQLVFHTMQEELTHYKIEVHNRDREIQQLTENIKKREAKIRELNKNRRRIESNLHESLFVMGTD